MRWRLDRAVAGRLGPAVRSLARRSGAVAEPLPSLPARRPFELVVHDVRRLHRRFLETRSGVSYAKSEGIRRAYDDALAEGCDALGLSHLLGVLDAGGELDQERTRVERLLHMWGLALDEPA